MDDEPVVELEVRPDGTVRFEVSGAPGAACEEWAELVLAALDGREVSRELTEEYYRQTRQRLTDRLRSRLKGG